MCRLKYKCSRRTMICLCTVLLVNNHQDNPFLKKTRGVSTFWSTDSRRSWPTVLQLYCHSFHLKLEPNSRFLEPLSIFGVKLFYCIKEIRHLDVTKCLMTLTATLLISLKLTPCRRQKILPVHYLTCPILPVHYHLGQRASQCWSIYPFIII